MARDNSLVVRARPTEQPVLRGEMVLMNTLVLAAIGTEVVLTAFVVGLWWGLQ